MNKGIALAGNMIVDNVKYIESYPPAQTLTTISGGAHSTGGLTCNCALTLAKLDPTLPLCALGMVGEDAAGDYILSQLAAQPNIDTSGVRRGGVTAYTDVMTDKDGGRTFFHCRGANALFAPEHIDLDNLRADILHIGYILLLDAMDAPDADYPTALCRVLHEAQKRGIATSVDVVSEDGDRFAGLVPPALRYTDYCIINEVEAECSTGIPLRDAAGTLCKENLEPACRALMEMGVARWVVIHMPECGAGLAKDGEFVCLPSRRVPDGFIKSSVGAGDAFASGILYGAYHGWTLEKSIGIAAAVAAWSLSGAGAADAIVPLGELLAGMQALSERE